MADKVGTSRENAREVEREPDRGFGAFWTTRSAFRSNGADAKSDRKKRTKTTTTRPVVKRWNEPSIFIFSVTLNFQRKCFIFRILDIHFRFFISDMLSHNIALPIIRVETNVVLSMNFFNYLFVILIVGFFYCFCVVL